MLGSNRLREEGVVRSRNRWLLPLIIFAMVIAGCYTALQAPFCETARFGESRFDRACYFIETPELPVADRP